MNLIEKFELAGGTIPGTEHTKPGRPGWKNNQDALSWRMSSDVIVGAVCDGCGSGQHSEVGAKIGCKILTDTAFTLLSANKRQLHSDRATFLELIEVNILSRLHALATAMRSPIVKDNSIIPIVHDYFLFTILFFVITPEETVIFSLGDGVYSINDNPVQIGPFQNNEPPYLSYRLSDRETSMHLGPYKIKEEASLSTEDLSDLLIGTDGVVHFVENEKTIIHRSKEPLGPLSQFWNADKYFINNDAVRRTLAMANHEYSDGRLIRCGPLFDDIALIVVREKKERPML